MMKTIPYKVSQVALLVAAFALINCSGGGQKKSEDDTGQDSIEEREHEEFARYAGSYTMVIDDENVTSTLALNYKGSKVFAFELKLTVKNYCSGIVLGDLTMDSPDHGVFVAEGCPLDFKFNGMDLDKGYLVEVTQTGICDNISEECSMGGTFTKKPS